METGERLMTDYKDKPLREHPVASLFSIWLTRSIREDGVNGKLNAKDQATATYLFSKKQQAKKNADSNSTIRTQRFKSR